MVDEIVDELAKDTRIAAAYGLWYELREEMLRTYKDDLPERLPLSQQKEFKRIKNIVIEEAVRLGEQTKDISQGTATGTSDTPEPDSITQQSIPPSNGPAITVSATTRAACHSTTIPPAVWTCSTRPAFLPPGIYTERGCPLISTKI